MPERKTWSQEEDRILRFLKEERGQKKWSIIARKMEEEFGVAGRTGKQCRERYHNHLDSAIVTTGWSHAQQELLFEMHDEVGNKWSSISHKLPGRSDNCVKNHFYSKLRKAVRRLNKLVLEHQERQLHIIKLAVLYKIIETTEERFKNNTKMDEEVVETCVAIKNKLFKFSETQNMNSDTAQLIADINAFETKVRRGAKAKDHRNSTETICSSNDPQTDLTKKVERTSFGKQNQSESEPFYKIFKRVCEQILLNELA